MQINWITSLHMTFVAFPLPLSLSPSLFALANIKLLTGLPIFLLYPPCPFPFDRFYLQVSPYRLIVVDQDIHPTECDLS